jgi:hypothetical protein
MCPDSTLEDFDLARIADVVNQDQDVELRRLRGTADQLARAVEAFVQQQRPHHASARCVDTYGGTRHVLPLAPEDWSAGGCEDLCPTCLMNRALSIYRGRA